MWSQFATTSDSSTKTKSAQILNSLCSSPLCGSNLEPQRIPLFRSQLLSTDLTPLIVKNVFAPSKSLIAKVMNNYYESKKIILVLQLNLNRNKVLIGELAIL